MHQTYNEYTMNNASINQANISYIYKYMVANGVSRPIWHQHLDVK